MSQGVMFVAVGAKAGFHARMALQTLRNYHPKIKVLVVGDQKIKGAEFQPFEAIGKPGRWAKVNLDKLSPWDETLFLDADTRIRGNLSLGFRLLSIGWDFVMVPSRPQGPEFIYHATAEEREYTLDVLPADPYQLNTGVMWFSKTTRVKRFFAAWRDEWKRYKGVDQGAFLRALERRPMAVALLGRPYNGGRMVEHIFGAC